MCMRFTYFFGTTALLTSLAIATIFSAAVYATPPAAPVGKQWSQKFSDEFNGANLDVANWSNCYHWYYAQYDGCTNAGNNEKQWYTPSQISVSDGALRLKAEKRTGTGVGSGNVAKQFDYVSGMVSTGGNSWQTPAKQAFKYGYYEAKIKIPAGQGLWPAFWMLSADYTWPPEIDILEVLGHDTKTAHMNSHWADASGAHQQSGSEFISDTPLSEGWHTYAIDWQADKLVWYIDGVARKTLTGAAVPQEEMYLLLNLAVGGNWPGDPDTTTQFPATMEVDYVRTYQLEDAPVVTPPVDTTSPVIGKSTSNTGAGYASSLTVTAPVSDNVGVSYVELFIDGKWVAGTSAAPYSYVLNASSYSVGNHTMTIRAYDAAGNTSTRTETFQVTATKILWWYTNYRVRLL